MSTIKNVFVIGLDDFNHRKLKTAGSKTNQVFHPLLSIDEVTAGEGWSLDRTLEKAWRVLNAVPGEVDAIIGYWDFPVSLLAPILCARLGLVSPTLESVLKCEHKYWSRIEQQQVAADHIPPFQAVDPLDDASVAAIKLKYPFWLKPVKSFASHLGFRIRDAHGLKVAIDAMRRNIQELGDPFNQFFFRATVPVEVAGINGNHCLAEGLVSGRQCTLEGFVHGGRVEIYGVVDSIRHANRSTFARYVYPSQLPRPVKQQMAGIAERVLGQIGFNNSPFNMEFFWDAVRNRVWLLEINPRISQSHGDLFDKVDGVPHHKVLLDLALGRHPQWQKGAGRFRYAGKFFLRRFKDAMVTRIPAQEEIAAIRRELPGTLVEVTVREGQRLSDLTFQEQDSYSYIYAMLFIGADSRSKLMEKFWRCRDGLHFEFAESGDEGLASDPGGLNNFRSRDTEPTP